MAPHRNLFQGFSNSVDKVLLTLYLFVLKLWDSQCGPQTSSILPPGSLLEMQNLIWLLNQKPHFDKIPGDWEALSKLNNTADKDWNEYLLL